MYSNATAALLAPLPRWFGSLQPPRRWAISAKRRNRLLHALNGNGGPPKRTGVGVGGWSHVGGSGLAPRQLQEPQRASDLRAGGWSLPASVPAEELIRVYDTRVEQQWLRHLVVEALPMAPGHVEWIGGDFVTKPLRDDIVGLDPTRLRRWGPAEAGPHHLVVPPRPHQAAWLRRAAQQLPLEDPGTHITVCCIVDRASCPESWDRESLCKALPSALALLQGSDARVRVVAVGERPPVLRVPATEKKLPPITWEAARLAQSRVLLLVSLSLGGQEFHASWVRGTPPPLESSGMELLRVEFLLPPATRSQQAERSLRAALRKVADAVGCSALVAPQISQVQVEHGGVVCLLAVPRVEARAWLRGSGSSGVFLRPFWTKDTSSEIQRDRFTLHWLRGQAKEAERVWAALRDEPGFFGLLAGGPDIAVRLSPEAQVSQALQQVRFALQRQELAFRRANPDARWWKLGPLTQAECSHVRALIPKFGLSLDGGDQVRFGPAGRFRSFCFFHASGQPSRRTLDDGGWNSSSVELWPADPPPRRGVGNPPASLGRQPNSLPKESMWGGPRRPGGPANPTSSTPALPASGSPRLPAAAGGPKPATRVKPDHRAAVPARPSSVEDQLGALLQQMEALNRQNAAMVAELGELRRENALLRRRLEEASGFVHQPYGAGLPPSASQGPVGPSPSPPPSLGAPLSPSGRPLLSDVIMSTDSPAKVADPEAKRPRQGGLHLDDA